MIKKEGRVSRKTVKEARIAICPQFGCTYLEKVKPLKYSFIGFRKYPKCSKHKFPLVFVEEFIDDFIHAINACLFDISSLPPEDLTRLIKRKAPDDLDAFFNGWMYCNPIGRGAQIVSNYMDGLLRGFMKLLSRKQRKLLENEKSSKIHMLRLELNKIGKKYATFLEVLREKSEMFHDPKELHPLSNEVKKLLNMWLKDHLKEIHAAIGQNNSKFPIEIEVLSIYKEQYDKILHAGTCTLLLGKSPSLVNKGLSPFELFSAYHEFLNGGLCRELTREEMKSLLEKSQEFLSINEEEILNIQNDRERNLYNKSDDMRDEEHKLGRNDYENINSFNISIPNFRQKVKDCLKTLHSLIDGITEQKEIMWLKSLEILDELISRAVKGEFTIHQKKKPKVIAATIIYSVIISNEELSNISYRDLARIAGIGKSSINDTYCQYFEDYYPRLDFPFYAYSFGDINKLFSLYIFNFIKVNPYLTTAELLSYLKDIIIDKKYPKQLKKEDINILQRMLTHYQDIFSKYFSDLIEVVKQIIFSSKNHKLIKATIVIYPLVEYLEKNGINLLQKTVTFYKIVREIFDHLAEEHSDFFPERLSRAFEEKMSQQEYRKYYYEYRQIVGYRLKLFLIKNIYNGKFYKDGKGKCTECEKEGFLINTDVSRLNALTFHHLSRNKNEIFTSVRLYEIFTENQGDPYFLEKFIKQMESEKVLLICRSHHLMIHDFYFHYFKYFITWEKLFSLSAEEIHILVRIIVDNFRLTMNLSKTRKKNIRQKIKNRIKKKYIIDILNKDVCPTCGEFNIKKHIRAFDFCHLYPNKKLIAANSLFDSYSCSEIVEILRKEDGGFICTNCHSVLDMEYFNILDAIYDDKKIAEKTRQDHLHIKRKFIPISKKMVEKVGDPLKKEIKIRGNYIKYLNVIYELSKNSITASNNSISDNLKIGYQGVKTFFLRRRKLLEQYVNFNSGRQTTYSLNKRGMQFISLIHSFRNYYRSLELDECKSCILNMGKNCSATQPNQCPIIIKGEYLPFQL